MTEVAPQRCAIYTRTSSDENLTQEYNSLAAQRDACAAFILSQKHEGWIRAKRVYEDGGFSGGTLERPALRDLLADRAVGLVDIIVIYKIDRLTRSLRDFAHLSATFRRHNASFVAITQQFNTASSMGRLTLNILLTFAQFEREVASDRIRDKKASSTRRGFWMGGNPALGYDAPAKKLVVNASRKPNMSATCSERFFELRSMARASDRTWRRTASSRSAGSRKGGTHCGGANFTWHPLNHILTNPLYKGMLRLKGQTYPGRHEAIVDEATFDEVQELVKEVSAREKARRALAHPALLRSLIFDRAGEPFYPSHGCNKARRYNYYISQSMAYGKARRPIRSRMRFSATGDREICGRGPLGTSPGSELARRERIARPGSTCDAPECPQDLPAKSIVSSRGTPT